jgi:hypothetical protein
MTHGGFFLVLAGLATAAAIFLWLLERPIQSHES